MRYYRKLDEAKQSFNKALEFLDVAKGTEEKKLEIKKDLQKSISEIQEEPENNPIALLGKKDFKIWSPHKQVN